MNLIQKCFARKDSSRPGRIPAAHHQQAATSDAIETSDVRNCGPPPPPDQDAKPRRMTFKRVSRKLSRKTRISSAENGSVPEMSPLETYVIKVRDEWGGGSGSHPNNY